MLHLDDVQLYELSEAGPLLFKDPVRLAREARIRAIPSARIGPALGLPAPWVDAEAGRSEADPISLATYWGGRLAPPSVGARKPRRDRAKLPAETLLSPEEAAARLFATPSALERLDREGRMPSLRVDGAVQYDADLVELMAGEPDTQDAAEARRVEVRAWARYEYERAPSARPIQPTPVEPLRGTPQDLPGIPAVGSNEAAEPQSPDVSRGDPAAGESAPGDPAPGAYQIPTDLGFDDLGGSSDLLDVDGFDTVDED